MKKSVLLVLCFFCMGICIAQQSDEQITLNQLTAPSSPGSILLKIAPSEIEKPTELTNVWASLQNLSNNFTKLPSSFAIDFSPYKLLGKNKIDSTTTALGETKGPSLFKQTLQLSMAVRNTDSAEDHFLKNSTYIGLGFKFNIIRGQYDKLTKEKLRNIHKLNRINLAIEHENFKNSSSAELTKLENEQDTLQKAKDKKTISEQGMVRLIVLNRMIDSVQESIIKKGLIPQQHILDSNNKAIQKLAADFQIKRVGWSWDVAGGFASLFKNRTFNKSSIYNAGLWTTVAYTDAKKGAFLGLARFLYNPEQVYALNNLPNTFQKNIATLDAGFSYVYGHSQSKFNLSVEAIYRSVLTKNTVNPNWRLMLNADYAIFKNQKLSFSFGKNFDGTITKDGNLIAALSFVTGILNKTSVSKTSAD